MVLAPEGEWYWGDFQFPALAYLRDGSIWSRWGFGRDTAFWVEDRAEIPPTNAISKDGGRTWQYTTAEAGEQAVGIKMKNGKEFLGFVPMPGHTRDDWDRYTPAWRGDRYNLYFAEDFGVCDDTSLFAREYDPATGKVTQFRAELHWPNAPLRQDLCDWGVNGVTPICRYFALVNAVAPIVLDGDLYVAMYSNGFDSEADREHALHKYAGLSCVYIFRSCDCGHSWDYVSQILPDDDSFQEHRYYAGFEEPNMQEMEDGSVIMLLRTGFTNPTYITRSTDRCRTWSKPQKFDDFGVFPQMVRLGCGVTLTSYGRPALRIRATADPQGMVWNDPIDLMPNVGEENCFRDSCYNTALLPLDDHSVLLGYSDFHYPNGRGSLVKAVLVRKITVIEQENEETR